MTVDSSPEVWKKIQFDDNISKKENYLISNHGRIKKLKRGTDFWVLKRLHKIGGYECLHVVQVSGKRTARYIHKLVAETFIKKENEEQSYVLHIDFNKLNNNVSNLIWANKKERYVLQCNSPKFKNSVGNSKLTAGRVKMIKKKLNNPNRKTRMKMIAKQFGISEMQLYRIKTGENGGHVKVD